LRQRRIQDRLRGKLARFEGLLRKDARLRRLFPLQQRGYAQEVKVGPPQLLGHGKRRRERLPAPRRARN